MIHVSMYGIPTYDMNSLQELKCQAGGVQVPLGANMKMMIMALPTLLFLHMFMGMALRPLSRSSF